MSEHLSKPTGIQREGIVSHSPDMLPPMHPYDDVRPGEPIDLTSQSMDTGVHVPMSHETRDKTVDAGADMDYENVREESTRTKSTVKNIGQKVSSMAHLTEEDKKAMQQKANSIIRLPKEHPAVAAGIGAAIAGGVLLKNRRD